MVTSACFCFPILYAVNRVKIIERGIFTSLNTFHYQTTSPILINLVLDIETEVLLRAHVSFVLNEIYAY